MAALRQQTLRATIDWSFDLLSEEERTLLRRLSVFVGEWSLEAAEAICSGNEVDASDILNLLAQLVDKSLVISETTIGESVL
jgi:predicted ATPase